MNITLHKPRRYSQCTKRWVRPSYLTEYSRRNPYNSGYCEDQKLIQRLIETTTYTIFILNFIGLQSFKKCYSRITSVMYRLLEIYLKHPIY